MDKQALLDRWSFYWPLMDILIGGTSAIDIHALWVKDRAEALRFIKSYGYDLEDPIDAQKVHAIFVEALHFIESQLMPTQWQDGNLPPDEVLRCDDMCDLLLWASSEDVNHRVHQVWSCAILKIMHTISHIEGSMLFTGAESARNQIIGRFEQALFRNEAGQLFFGKKDLAIEVEKVEWKHAKTRSSILLKLLHKPANVAETVYDLVGVRIVTKTVSEALLAVKVLNESYIVDFPNTLPTRARNNLIDVNRFVVDLETFRQFLNSGDITPETFETFIGNLSAPVVSYRTDNPHSSQKYHSIQLTCRQRVNRQFYPFEVQITDLRSSQLVETGEGSHRYYKRQQIKTARRRILANILTLGNS